MRKISEFRYFYPEKPRLMHVGQELFDKLSRDPDWLAEPKINGKRLQLHHLPDGRFLFYNRHGEPMRHSPGPKLAEDLRRLDLKGYWLFDGELRDGKVKGVRDKVALWDVFMADGEVLVDKTYEERRGILETLFHYCGPDSGENLDLIQQFGGDFRRRFDAYKDDPEVEGLVLKNKNGKLALGRTGAYQSGWMWKVRKASGIARF